MLRKLAYAGVFVGAAAVATVVGCTDNGQMNGDRDFATSSNGDMAGGDMNVMRTYKSATLNAIDTNTIGGEFGKGTAVESKGLIVTSPIYGFNANQDADCRYQVYVQDPACSTPPCGLVIVTDAIPNPNGPGSFCGFQGSDATPLNGVRQGDKVDVKGVVDTFANTEGMDTVVQHEIEIDALEIVSSNETLPTPITVTDTATSIFTPYSGSGWAMYEGTLVKLQAPSGKLVTTLTRVTSGGKDCGGFNSNGGFKTAQGANFADNFNFTYVPDGGVTNCWPPDNSMFTSITGIVGLVFGGAILPVDDTGFVP